MGLNELKRKLAEKTDEGNILSDVPMVRHTSFRAGGRADIMVVPRSVEELREILGVLAQGEYPYMILGNGSNVLVRDGGYRGTIVKIGDAFNKIKAEGERLICGAGALLSTAARAAAEESLAGMEFASGIPGSIGGAVFMNAGAYGGEMKNIIERVRLISEDGSEDRFVTAEELMMGYRHTALHESGEIVVEAVLKLEKGDMDSIKSRMSELTAQRNSKQPVSFPSAGSFFKRPEGYFAGKLIQDAGLKGLSVGGAQVSQLHSGFIINRENATATDILQLMEIVQQTVMDKFGVMLEPEVRIIGE
ncbi:MAG: UDP-N-acetylmuramate dehydrogenase [Anaerovoracaceae bacterium]|nr:UDP-N-acetylmuramate dehydrogenase [Anaerovoracaceae bacterium]